MSESKVKLEEMKCIRQKDHICPVKGCGCKNCRSIRIFTTVMDIYEPARTLSLTMSCGGFYNSLGEESGAQGARVIRPSLSEFVCDVELAAQNVLTDDEYELFKDVHIEQNELTTLTTTQEVFTRTNKKVIHSVAGEFVRRRLYPLRFYFKAPGEVVA